MKRPAVFFDRDNTLIVSDGYLGDPAKVALVKGAADAVARARGLGYAVVVFSNQSGVARGMFSEEDVQAVNARTDELLRAENAAAIIDRHEFCPFHPEGTIDVYARESDRRKPKPGMILAAAEKLALDLTRSWVVGDAGRDIEAGRAAGCRTILFSDAELARSPAALVKSSATPDHVVATLGEAIDFIERNPEGAGISAAGEAVQTPAAAGDGAEMPPLAPSVAPSAVAAEPVTVAAPVVTPPTGPRVPKVVIGSKYVPPEGKAATPATAKKAFRKADESDPAGMGVGSDVERDAGAKPRAASVAEPAARRAAVRAEAEEAARPVAPLPPTGLERVESLLEQIFLELRRQHEQQASDFSVSKLLAGVVQVLVLAVLFFAYLRRDFPAGPGTYLSVALVLQTMTIALLIMSRQK